MWSFGFNSLFLSAVEQGGFRVPEDIGFAALPQSADPPPSIWVLRERRTLLIDSEWIDGETLPMKKRVYLAAG